MLEIDNALSFLSPIELESFQTFYPFAYKKITNIIHSKKRFVHYSTAEAAVSIIRNKEVWMRQASTMNDFQEIEHGRHCLQQALKHPSGEKLKKLLEDLFPGLWSKLFEFLEGWYGDFRNETYIACISEHDSPNEDSIGRLSMWRAYGGTVGVALVLNPYAFIAPSNALDAYTSPVAYLSPADFITHFVDLVSSLECKKELLIELQRETVLNHLFNIFKLALLSTKHPGFHEEKEWRIIHSPTLQKSVRLKKEIHSIRGVPQKIYKIPLANIPEENLLGVEPDQLLERIIVGPSDQPYEIREAFIELLEENGVTNASDRVTVSTIPLRTRS
ncbi:DUF2971 domain-containing protein [Tepidicaulis sp.]|uniref:DUF2971 domain-containing protein n=1 Tax=Tepidicaulis sp. TaxID=1920809 RepID=UPI003B5B20D3